MIVRRGIFIVFRGMILIQRGIIVVFTGRMVVLLHSDLIFRQITEEFVIGNQVSHTSYRALSRSPVDAGMEAFKQSTIPTKLMRFFAESLRWVAL